MDISVLLKIYGYEYDYAKFSWILSMGSPNLRLDCCLGQSNYSRDADSLYPAGYWYILK
jgi:hypothetical protein